MVTKREFALSIQLAYMSGTGRIRGSVHFPASSEVEDLEGVLSYTVDEIGLLCSVNSVTGKVFVVPTRDLGCWAGRNVEAWTELLTEYLGR